MEGKLLTKEERRQERRVDMVNAYMRNKLLDMEPTLKEEIDLLEALEPMSHLMGIDYSQFSLDAQQKMAEWKQESHRQQIADWGYCGPEEGCETCDYDREEREEEGDD